MRLSPARAGIQGVLPWLGLFILLNVLDAVMTCYGLTHGSRELVPAPAFLLRQLGMWAFLVAKGFEVAGICGLLLLCSLFLPRWARVLGIGGCIWFSGLVVWNGLTLAQVIRV